MLVTPLGMVMLSRLLQPKNACLPIIITVSGILIFLKLVHPENALFPITVNVSGSVTLVKFLQPENPLPMVPFVSGRLICVTPSGIVMSPLKAAGTSIISVSCLLYSTPSQTENMGWESSTLKLSSNLQSEKTVEEVLVDSI